MNSISETGFSDDNRTVLKFCHDQGNSREYPGVEYLCYDQIVYSFLTHIQFYLRMDVNLLFEALEPYPCGRGQIQEISE